MMAMMAVLVLFVQVSPRWSKGGASVDFLFPALSTHPDYLPASIPCGLRVHGRTRQPMRKAVSAKMRSSQRPRNFTW